MKKLITLAFWLCASSALAGTAPCTQVAAAAETILAADFNNCTWSSESFVAEGSTADADESTITFVDPTEDMTFQIPDLAVAGTFTFGFLEADQTWSGLQSFVTPALLSKVDWNNTVVDDDDCTGEQGKSWYDTTDLAFEYCNANTGAPAVIASSSGDVTRIGDCTSGDCFVTGGSGTKLDSDSNFTIELDANSDGTSTFIILDGAGASVLEVDEDGDVTATSFTADASASPTVGFDDSVAAGTEAQIVGNATADNNGSLDFQVEEASATYFSALRIDSTAGAVVLRLGGTAANNDISISEAGVVTFAGTAVPTKSIPFNAAGLTSDGTQCADAAKVTINSGPVTYTIICTDNDASSIYGQVTMPDGWDGGTVTFEHEYLQSAADTSALNGDIAAQCRGAGETPSSTWGTEIAIDDAAVGGSNIIDHTTSAAVTPAGTCAAGDTLWFRYQLDATGTTTAVATLHHVGFKMEYGISALSD